MNIVREDKRQTVLVLGGGYTSSPNVEKYSICSLPPSRDWRENGSFLQKYSPKGKKS